MSIKYAQLLPSSLEPWTVVGPPDATTVALHADLVVNYSGGTTDTIPAGTVSSSIDRSTDVWVIYTVPGSLILSLVKESLLSGLTGDWCPLARLTYESLVHYQPVDTTSGGGGGTGNMDWRGAWAGSTTYDVDDVVVHGGVSYICTSAVAPSPGSYDTEVLADSPTAYWKLTESGTTIGSTYADTTGNGYDVAVAGGAITHEDGPFLGDSAPVFPSGAALLSSVTTGLPVDGTSFTIEAWVQPAVYGGRMSFFSYGDPVSLATYNEVAADMDPGPGGWFEIFTTGAGANAYVGADQALDDGAWHHLVIVFNTSVHIDFFLDGIRIYRFAISSGSTYTASGTAILSLGDTGAAATSPAEENYLGALSRVAIYPTILTAGRISTHYTAMGLSPAPGSDSAHWTPLDVDTAGEADDAVATTVTPGDVLVDTAISTDYHVTTSLAGYGSGLISSTPVTYGYRFSVATDGAEMTAIRIGINTRSEYHVEFAVYAISPAGDLGLGGDTALFYSDGYTFDQTASAGTAGIGWATIPINPPLPLYTIYDFLVVAYYHDIPGITSAAGIDGTPTPDPFFTIYPADGCYLSSGPNYGEAGWDPLTYMASTFAYYPYMDVVAHYAPTPVAATLDVTTNKIRPAELGLTTPGDMLYLDASGHLQRVPGGTPGQLLTVGAGGLPEWSS